MTDLLVVGGREERSHLLGWARLRLMRSLSLSLSVYSQVYAYAPGAGQGAPGRPLRCTMVLSAGRVYLDYELEGGPKVTPRIPFQ